jgi:transcriptional regulator with XRE-family HTH domain
VYIGAQDERFGQRLRGPRQRANLSQEEFAEKSGPDRTYISGIEHGKRNVALRNIRSDRPRTNIAISESLKGL